MEPDQQAISTPVDQQPPSGKKATNMRLIGVVVILIIAGLGYLGYQDLYLKWRYNHNHSASYSSLRTFSLPGDPSVPYSGASFSVPSQFQRITDNNSKRALSSATLVDYQNGSKSHSLSSIVIASNLRQGASKDSAYVKSVNELMKVHSGAGYDTFKRSLQDYLETVAGKSYSWKIQAPTALGTSNINKDAWAFEFSAYDHANQAFSPGQPVLQGKLILAFGGDSYYYFLIDSTQNNWLKNQPTWQRVINSLKINQ